jgi:hypothetical protein
MNYEQIDYSTDLMNDRFKWDTYVQFIIIFNSNGFYMLIKPLKLSIRILANLLESVNNPEMQEIKLVPSIAVIKFNGFY